MKNISINKQLKSLRKEKSLTVEQVAEYLSKRVHPISSKAVYSWENGTTHPRLEMFLALCEYYGVDDLNSAFFGNKKSSGKKDGYRFLTEKEWEFLQCYRSRDDLRPIVNSLYDIYDHE